MITPSLIYKFPSLKYCSNESVPFFFLDAVLTDIVIFKTSIDNVALMQYTCFLFSQTLTQYRSQIQMGPLYRKIPNLLIHFTRQQYYFSLSPARPAKRPSSRESRTLRQVAHKLYGHICTMVFALRGAIQHWQYFFMRSYLHHLDIDGHVLRRYIFFMRSYLHHLDVIERQSLAKPRRRKGTEVLFCFVSVFFFFFSLTVVLNKY